ncbi:MAG: acyl-CoA thioesterase [Acidimicrobiia bacterium]|nr:acyl-CoA thioesterase [Acidimicrobiia bacterium]MDQ3500166.1 acyl-CoA thioesterase [Actinomycetota bacterium]
MSHQFALRPRFYELDPYNHVNHTSYLQYFEAARVEALAEVGLGLDVMQRRGFQIVLVELTARFFEPATLHEDLIISTTVAEIGRASSIWSQEIRRGDDRIATLDLRAAFTNLDGRPTRPPPDFAELMGSI